MKEVPLRSPNVSLVTPYGGSLVDLVVPPGEMPELKAAAAMLPSLQISTRNACDLELLATGGFSPLDRFMGRADYSRVLGEMRLHSGRLFPVPVTLAVSPGGELRLDRDVALRDAKNDILAIMTIEEIYDWDPAVLAREVLGTEDVAHPFVAEMEQWGRLNITGRLRVIQLPTHHDFRDLRLTPVATRARLTALGYANVVALQTSHASDRVHELTRRVTREVDASLLLQPVVGMTKPGDVDHVTRVRAYRALSEQYYERDRTELALLPLAMRMAGPREAVWQALILRNYGANHFIVGWDHASPGADSAGKPFYGRYEAQELVTDHHRELGVAIVPFEEHVSVPAEGRGRGWSAHPEVSAILAEAYAPRHRQGVCVWFTGLSGSGKSTTAEILTVLLMEAGRQVTLLDGDVVRTHLSKGLGFSRQDRDTNIRRIGFVAAEIVRHGGVVICAAVSPYRATRDDARSMVGLDRFVEVFVDTPLEVCEQRDAKGMYARARRGEIKGFTGIDDPYEAPVRPDLTLDTVLYSAEHNARLILEHLWRHGFLEGRS